MWFLAWATTSLAARNAVVVAAVTLYFAGLRDDDAPALVAYVAARGRSRAAADLATAVAHVSGASDRDAAYRSARGLVMHSHRREIAAVASVRRMASRGRAADYVRQASAALEGDLDRALDALEQAYVALTGRTPPNGEPSKEEREMARKVYVPVTDPGAWMDALDKISRSPACTR